MKKTYDFSNSKPNPYAQRLKQQVTILLDKDAVAYFKRLAEETGVRYQVLINLYLKECASQKKRLAFAKPSAARKKAA
jgi:uncharacterized protein (DUF4415 family)